jgi:hypothetical protein
MNKLKNRALKACEEYDNVKRKIDKATSLIGECLDRCHTRQMDKFFEEKDSSSFLDLSEQELKEFENVTPCLSYNGAVIYYDCNDCKRANDIIQRRKELRQKFGVAKRKIRAVARKNK